MNLAGGGLQSGDLARLLRKQLRAEAWGSEPWERHGSGGSGKKEEVAAGPWRAGSWSCLCRCHWDFGPSSASFPTCPGGSALFCASPRAGLG